VRRVPLPELQQIAQSALRRILNRIGTGLQTMPPEQHIVIAVLDSGVDCGHPDFQFGAASLASGDPPMCSDSASHGWHGTAVAGIIAAGIKQFAHPAGAAPPASIRSYRITDEEHGTVHPHRIVAAMQAAMADGARVINLSASWSEDDASLQRALLLAKEGAITAAGALIVATSPGYLTHSGAQYPGVYADADRFDFLLSVAGFGMKRLQGALADRRPCISPLASTIAWNREHPDNGYAPRMLAAPGEDILTALPGNRHGRVRGDSFAAPYVTGLAAAALLQPAYRHMKAAGLRRLLFETACSAPPALRNLAGGAGIHCIASDRFIETLNCPAWESRYDA